MKAEQALALIRSLVPEVYQDDWDNSRVQIAGTRGAIKKIAVALDPAVPGMRAALDWGADLVLTHHPLYFKPAAPTTPGQYLDVLRLFLASGAWLYAAHTSLDCRPEGPAFWLGRALGLANCACVEPTHRLPAREVFFQAPSKFTEREARPLLDAPGVHALSQSAAGEVRVVCDESAWDDVREKLRFVFADRPIDFYVRRLEQPAVQLGFGQVGDLPAPLDCEDFARVLEKTLFGVQQPMPATAGSGVAWVECGPRPAKIRRVAYTTGSGASLIPAAFAAGADVFICGDVKHHAAMETPGLVFDVGHFILEEEMIRLLSLELAEAVRGEAEVRFFKGASPFRFRVLA